MLVVNQACISLGRALVHRGPIPEKAAVDALHIAIATVHGMDYLLTWNCKHIANTEMQTAESEPPAVAGGYKSRIQEYWELTHMNQRVWTDEIVSEPRAIATGS